MRKQRTQGILFYQTGRGKNMRLRMWTNISYMRAQREWQYYLLGKFVLGKCPNRYVKAKGSMKELGLASY
jgi:hypothetical protein